MEGDIMKYKKTLLSIFTCLLTVVALANLSSCVGSDVNDFVFGLSNDKKSYIILEYDYKMGDDPIINFIMPKTYKGLPVTGIDDNCFFLTHKSLKTVKLHNKVNYIHPLAFSGCSNIEKISVDPKNPYFDSRDNCNAIIRTDSNTLVRGCKNTKIPNDVVGIEQYAFSSADLSAMIPFSQTAQSWRGKII